MNTVFQEACLRQKARYGSKAILFAASRIQSNPAAIHIVEEKGIRTREILATIAPIKKNGFAGPILDSKYHR